MPLTNRTLGDALGGCIDPFKGLLILVVVIDHNDVAHALFPATFRPLTFHVLGFLLLPFLVRQPRLSWMFVLDRFARYWVPYLSIMTVSSLLFWLLYHRGEVPSRVLLEYVVAVAIGSAPLVKEASGFLAYWFLPALLGLVVVLSLYRSVSVAWRRFMVALFVAAHCALVAQSFGVYYWVPFGLAIVANVFLLGLVLRAVMASGIAYRLRYLFPIAFVLSYGWLVQRDVWLEIMVLQMAPITSLSMFIAQDVAALSGIVTVLLIADGLRERRSVASIGRHSLMIYLLHPLVYVPVTITLLATGLRTVPIGAAILFGVASFVAAALGSWAGAALLARSRMVCTWFTPRYWSQWGPVATIRSVIAYRA